MTEGWRAGYDAWKTRAPEMPTQSRSQPSRYRCTVCGVDLKGGMARFEHYHATGHVVNERQKVER